MSSQQGAYAIMWFVFWVSVVVFVIVLGISACSGCDLRRRGDKAACRAGNADKCLAVGQYYEGKADGILGFAMSNGNTSTDYYYLACKYSSAHGCTKMMDMFRHSESARTEKLTMNEMADAMIATCADQQAPTPQDSEACKPLWQLMDDYENAANRVAMRFGEACNDGKKVACYWLAKLRPGDNAGSDAAGSDVATSDAGASP